eukprot:13159298-Ditylum_brightwellii.AAC.1
MAVDSECCVHRKCEEVETESWCEMEGGNDFWDQFSASEQESDDFNDALDGELGFTYMKEFPTSLNLLPDPNVWICDAGASTHAGGHKCGMTKLRETKKGNHIMGMNGKQEESTMIAKIPGTVCDKYGNGIRLLCPRESVAIRAFFLL